MKDNLKTGKPDAKHDDPAHVSGIRQGNAKGNYEDMAGHEADGTSTAERSTGIRPDAHGPILPSMPNLSPA